MTPDDPTAGDRFASDIELLIRAVLDTPGELSRDRRAALFDRAAAIADFGNTQADTHDGDAALETFINKLIHHAYKVTQSDIDRVLDLGYSQDAVFETVVSVATGAGIGRRRRGLTALDEAASEFNSEME